MLPAVPTALAFLALGLALIAALSSGRVPAGGRVMVLACGAGYTAGGMILRVDKTLMAQTHPLEDT